MSEAAKLFVSIGADISDLVKKLDTASSKLKNAFTPSLDASKMVAAGVAVVGAGLAAFAVGAVKHLGEVSAISAQTAAALKSTGGAAQVTAEQVGNLAGSISAMSGIGDEAIQSGENIILTFTNIKDAAGKGNDVFTQTTEIMTDMSVALEQDMKSSAINLGKALNDPIQGVSALQRVGVSFTEGQKAQIKALQESGNVMGAQKLILAELNKEFGGSAESYGKTLPGAIGKASEAFEGLGDALMSGAVPVLTNGIGMIADVVNDLAGRIQASGVMGAFNEIFGPEVKAAVLGLAGAVTIAMIPAIAAAASGLGAAVVAAAPFIATAAAIGAAAYVIMKNWGSISGFFSGVFNAISGAVGTFFNNVRGAFSKIGEIVSTVVAFLRDKLGPIFNLLPDGAKRALADVGGHLSALPGLVVEKAKAVGGAAVGMGQAIANPIMGAVGTAQGFIGKLTASLPAQIAKAAPAAGAAMGQVGGAISDEAKKAAEAAKKAAKEIADAFASVPAKLGAISVKARIFGESQDVAAKKAAALRQEIESLIDKGVSPADKRLAGLIAQWGNYHKAAEAAKVQTFDVSKAMADVKKAMGEAAAKGATFGASFDVQGEKARILEGALNKMIEGGVKPSDAAFQKLKKQLGDLKPAQDGVTAAMGKFKVSTTDVMSSVSGLKDGLKTIGDTLGVDLGNGFMEGVAKGGNFALALVQVGQSVMTLIPAIVTQLVPAVIGMGTMFMSTAVPALIGFATTAISTVVPAAIAMGSSLWVALGPFGLIAAAIAGVIAVGALLVANWQAISEFLSGVWQSIAGFFQSVWNGIVGVFQKYGQQILNIATIFFAPILVPIRAMIAIGTLLRDHWGEIAAGLAGIWKGIATTASGAFSALVGIVKGPLNFIIGLVNRFIAGLNRIQIPSFVPGIGGMGVNIPTIPYLAKGGVIDSPTVAMVGEAGPEAVVPLKPSVLAGIGAGIGQGAGGGDTTVYITINADSQDVGEVIVKQLQSLGIKP